MIRVFIADDHPLMLTALADLIDGYIGFEKVGQSNNGAEALIKIEQQKPDVAILDMDMPYLSGIEVISKASPTSTKFILLTFHRELEIYNKAMEVGASGYILKDQNQKDIIQAILQVHKGKKYTSPLVQKNISTHRPNIDMLSLTKTEFKILKLVAAQNTSAQISGLLFVSEKTIENHRSNICKKLNLNGRKNSLLSWAIANKDYII